MQSVFALPRLFVVLQLRVSCNTERFTSTMTFCSWQRFWLGQWLIWILSAGLSLGTARSDLAC